MLFDEAGAILLVRFVVPREGGEFVFWALPGGEIEAGETEIEAAEREVREELGLELKVTGPIYRDCNQFFHQGEMQDNVDFLFRAECGIHTEIATVARFPWDYPGSEPVPFDAAKRFQARPGQQLADRHMGPDGQCCLWLPPCSLWDSANPDGLREFLDELAIFFDRQLIYDLTGKWPGPSYGHGTEGYLEFIREQLGNDASLGDILIPLITMKTEVSPNDVCPCGTGKKFKKCHRHLIERIQGQIGVGRVRRVFGISRS